MDSNKKPSKSSWFSFDFFGLFRKSSSKKGNNSSITMGIPINCDGQIKSSQTVDQKVQKISNLLLRLKPAILRRLCTHKAKITSSDEFSKYEMHETLKDVLITNCQKASSYIVLVDELVYSGYIKSSETNYAYYILSKSFLAEINRCYDENFRKSTVRNVSPVEERDVDLARMMRILRLDQGMDFYGNFPSIPNTRPSSFVNSKITTVSPVLKPQPNIRPPSFVNSKIATVTPVLKPQPNIRPLSFVNSKITTVAPVLKPQPNIRPPSFVNSKITTVSPVLKPQPNIRPPSFVNSKIATVSPVLKPQPNIRPPSFVNSKITTATPVLKPQPNIRPPSFVNSKIATVAPVPITSHNISYHTSVQKCCYSDLSSSDESLDDIEIGERKNFKADILKSTTNIKTSTSSCFNDNDNILHLIYFLYKINIFSNDNTSSSERLSSLLEKAQNLNIISLDDCANLLSDTNQYLIKKRAGKLQLRPNLIEHFLDFNQTFLNCSLYKNSKASLILLWQSTTIIDYLSHFQLTNSGEENADTLSILNKADITNTLLKLQDCNLFTHLSLMKIQCYLGGSKFMNKQSRSAIHLNTTGMKKILHNIRNFDAILKNVDKLDEATDEDDEVVYRPPEVKYVVTFLRLIDKPFYATSKSCQICLENFDSQMSFMHHLEDHHKNKYTFSREYTQCNQKLQLYIERVDTSATCFDFKINCFVNRFDVQNVYMIHPGKTFKNFDVKPAEVTKKNPLYFSCNSNLFTLAPNHYQIYVHFLYNDCDYVEHFNLFVYNLPNIIGIPDIIVDDAELIKRRRAAIRCMKTEELPLYFPSKEIRMLVVNQFKLKDFMESSVRECRNLLMNFKAAPVATRLSVLNYCNIFSKIIQIEDVATEVMMYEYDKSNQTFEVRNQKYYILKIPNLSENRPSLLQGDMVWIVPDGLPKGVKGDKINGQIFRVESEYIVLEFFNKKKEKRNTDAIVAPKGTPVQKIDIDIKKKYTIHFLMNRTPYKMERQALDILNSHKIVKTLLFPQFAPATKPPIHTDFDWSNKNIVSNPEQMQAVKNIVNCTAYPLPYILFGPPGTGKTSTVVEAIFQLMATSSNRKVLVATASNSACDEIALRLLKCIPEEIKMLRLFSASREKLVDKIDDDIIKISNLSIGMHYYPALDILYKYDIVLATLCVAGKLVQGNIDARHFSHVFIDECGSATEPSALIAIAGLITSPGSVNGNIVLAGDPLQLGPIIQSEFAESLGYGVSLLERMMNLPVYKKCPLSNEYNTNIITKLVQNFRSHASILHLSNKIFYENELTAMGNSDQINWALQWKQLPNKNFPIILKSVKGQCKRDANSPSWYNLEEIKCVTKYLELLFRGKVNGKQLEASNIGIISPYVKQCQKLRNVCERRNWRDIEIASVETYQGREKDVIILSLVRSNVNSVGFLNNPKRFNVALTRAKALMIIICDTDVLNQDPYWSELIDYCAENNAVIPH